MNKIIMKDWYTNGVFPECHVYGENFYPSRLLSIENILFSSMIDRDDIAPKGRNKDMKSPYGSCSILTPKEIANKIEWMAEFIFQNKHLLEQAGGTDIVFWLYWYGEQGNMELTINQIELINKTKTPLAMTYITIE